MSKFAIARVIAVTYLDTSGNTLLYWRDSWLSCLGEKFTGASFTDRGEGSDHTVVSREPGFLKTERRSHDKSQFESRDKSRDRAGNARSKSTEAFDSTVLSVCDIATARTSGCQSSTIISEARKLLPPLKASVVLIRVSALALKRRE